MCEHECHSDSKVRILVYLIAGHFINHGTLQMNYFVMGNRQDVIFTAVVAHGKGQFVVIVLTEVRI